MPVTAGRFWHCRQSNTLRSIVDRLVCVIAFSPCLWAWSAAAHATTGLSSDCTTALKPSWRFTALSSQQAYLELYVCEVHCCPCQHQGEPDCSPQKHDRDYWSPWKPGTGGQNVVKEEIDWQIFPQREKGQLWTAPKDELFRGVPVIPAASGGRGGGMKCLCVFRVTKGWCRYEAVAKIPDDSAGVISLLRGCLQGVEAQGSLCINIGFSICIVSRRYHCAPWTITVLSSCVLHCSICYSGLHPLMQSLHLHSAALCFVSVWHLGLMPKDNPSQLRSVNKLSSAT